MTFYLRDEASISPLTIVVLKDNGTKLGWKIIIKKLKEKKNRR